MNITYEQLVQAFTDWGSAYRANPSESLLHEEVSKQGEAENGELSAQHLIKYLRQRGVVTTVCGDEAQ